MKIGPKWRNCSINALRLPAVSISLGGFIALRLIELTGPTGNIIEINPNEIVTMREPYKSDSFGKEIHCVIYTSDGRLVGAQESCEHIKQMINEEQ